MSVRSVSSLPPVAARFSINVIENRDNAVLMLKRAQTAGLGPGLWGFPAGHIEPGETPASCAWRELHEEIGERFRTLLVTTLGPIRDTQYGGVYEIYLFHRRWEDGEIVLNDEHTDYAWVAKEDFVHYDAMQGIDEDIIYLDIWPARYVRKV